MAINTPNTLLRDLVVLENESSPESSDIITIRPSTTLDQVFDDRSASNKNLRTIIEELRTEIATGGRGDIHFPVTSVNGKTGNIILGKNDINLDKVDNTPDDEKPLSRNQSIAIYEILANYDFHIDLTRFDEHLIDMDNPHGVTLSQLNANGEVTNTIDGRIRLHDRSNTSHSDIRSTLRNLDSKINTTEESIERLIADAMTTFEHHNVDEHAHQVMFESKENVSNKVMDFTEYDHVKYPSTRAVVEYVGNRLVEFKQELPDIQQWIDDIIFVDKRTDLPPANINTFRKAYYIRYGNGNHPEVAICRLNPNGCTYDWEISILSTYSKFDESYFSETTNGLSLNITPIAEKVIEDDIIINSIREQLERLMPSIMGNYYTKDEINDFHFIQSIHMLPGTQDGTIRYYINDDTRTMSDDIRIQGLQRLAFLEWVTEDELADQSVHSRHILDRAIEHRHMGNKAVSYKNMQATHMTMLGNLEDPENRGVQEITIPELAYTLNPYIDAGSGDGRFIVMPVEEVLYITWKAHRKQAGWIDPELCVTVYLTSDGNLHIEYDHEDPDIWIDEEGFLNFNWDNTCTDNALLRFGFFIDEEGNLIVNYTEVDHDKPAEFIPTDEGYMILEYSELYPTPQITTDEDGNTILVSYESPSDDELEKYRFIQTSEGTTTMFYDWPDWENLPAYFNRVGEDLVITYDEAYGQPEIWIDNRTGYLYLNSYDTENDQEIERYLFRINPEGELEAEYLE